jgi:hypothetical protein
MTPPIEYYLRARVHKLRESPAGHLSPLGPAAPRRSGQPPIPLRRGNPILAHVDGIDGE